ncbi:hypothetical protein B0H67DRAFT_32568 [Lasiosphaeris hirsuta]|uniref:Uncharacterized protein n=1 Tax=Lasiosphaeris hirsuta TaxID=260670 RepID=A0AA40BA02_9PEZI|nr:hypothetical protein B0H67DRAFT_32568 [Lasiosphaeris hirsuta]
MSTQHSQHPNHARAAKTSCFSEGLDLSHPLVRPSGLRQLEQQNNTRAVKRTQRASKSGPLSERQRRQSEANPRRGGFQLTTAPQGKSQQPCLTRGNSAGAGRFYFWGGGEGGGLRILQPFSRILGFRILSHKHTVPGMWDGPPPKQPRAVGGSAASVTTRGEFFTHALEEARDPGAGRQGGRYVLCVPSPVFGGGDEITGIEWPASFSKHPTLKSPRGPSSHCPPLTPSPSRLSLTQFNLYCSLCSALCLSPSCYFTRSVTRP